MKLLLFFSLLLGATGAKSIYEFTMKDIPDCIDDEGKIVLLKRLTREGLLKIK